MQRILGYSTNGVRVMKLPLKSLSVWFRFLIRPSVLRATHVTVISALVPT
jgi:hypothetical protein